MLRLTHLVHGRSWVREPVSLVYNQATKEKKAIESKGPQEGQKGDGA